MKEKLEMFPPLDALADKRCTSGDGWTPVKAGGFIVLNLHGCVLCSHVECLPPKVDKTPFLLGTGKHFDDPLGHNPGQKH